MSALGIPQEKPQKVEISHRTIIFTVLFLLSLFLLYQIRQILVLLFVSLILMSAFNPAVCRLEKIKIPRVLAILLIYFLIFFVMGLTIAGIVPVLIEQTASLVSRFPEYIQALQLPTVDQSMINVQVSQLGSIPASLIKITATLFNNLTGFLVVLVITFYFLIERKNMDHYLAVLFSGNGVEKAQVFVDRLEHRLGGWVRAQLALMVIIGVMSYVGLRLLGIEFALPLALLAAVLEIVPNIGPTLAAIPAILAGLAVSPLMALAVAALYFLVQQIENSLIVPQVMAKGVGVKPLVVIISLAIGIKVAGFLGVVLAIPFVILVQAVMKEFLASYKYSSLSKKVA